MIKTTKHDFLLTDYLETSELARYCYVFAPYLGCVQNAQTMGAYCVPNTASWPPVGGLLFYGFMWGITRSSRFVGVLLLTMTGQIEGIQVRCQIRW